MAKRRFDRTSADKPLTDAQERFLIAVDDADWHKACNDAGYTLAVGTEVERVWHEVHYLPVRDDDRPRERLEAMGLVELRIVDRPLSFSQRPRDVTEARITEAGVAMLRSMGD